MSAKQSHQRRIRQERRPEKGQTLALVAVCALVLVIVCSAFVAFGLFLGGEQELNTATKSGALNVAVQMLNPDKVSASCLGTQFAELGDRNNNITLANVNLVYAKALMVAANAQDIENKGLSNSLTRESLDALVEGADSICRQLNTKASNSQYMQNFFQSMAENNSVRMFGGKNSRVAADPIYSDSYWKIAYVYSGTESNVSINNSQLPSGSSIGSQLVQANGQSFFPGYKAISVAGKTFCLIPYKYGGQPKLISMALFNQNKQTPSASVTVLPNAWSVYGQELGSSAVGASSVACASTHPELVLPFQMQGFIRITLNPAEYTMEGDGEPCGEGSFGFGPDPVEVESTEFEVPLCCLGQMQATLNLECEPGDLYTVLFPPAALETGESETMAALLQRVNEFCPSCSSSDVTRALGEAFTDGSPTQNFFLYCTRTGVSSSLICSSNPSAPYPFMNFFSSPDSSPMIIAEQEFAVDDPDFAVLEVEPEADCEGDGVAEVECTSSNLSWSPGTGYNGFLGQLSLSRSWLVSGEAFCIVIPPI